MKTSNKLSLALYNLVKRKKTTAQCVVMTAIIMLLIFVCAFFLITFTIQLQDNLNNYASTNFIYLKKNYDGEELTDQKIDELVARFPTINQVSKHYELGLVISSPTYIPLTLDGTDYVGEDEDYWVDVMFKQRPEPIFANNQQLEFEQRFKGQSIITAGRTIENNNEVLFPEQLLRAFNVTESQLLSANSVSYGGILENVKVVGIVNENFCKIGEVDSNINFVYIFADLSTVLDRFSVELNVRLYLTGADEVDSITNYIIENTDLIHGYGNSVIKGRLELISKLQTFMIDIITVLCGVVGVALVVFLFSVLDYSAKQKGSYHGMMRAMGLKNTLSITLLEMLIISVTAAVVCLALSLITVFSLNGVIIELSWTSTYTIVVNGAIFALVFIATFVIVAALNVALTLFAERINRKSTISAALRQ